MTSLMPLRTRPAPPVDPREAALWWSSRRRLGLADASDEVAFRTWLEIPAHAAAFAEADDPVEALGAMAASDDIRAMREAALASTPARIGVRRLRGLPIAAGIAIALLAGLGTFMVLPVQNGASPPLVTSGAAAPAYAVQRYETAVGERREVALEDGSIVTLNTGSLIEVAYDERTRAVRLLHGQALFEVAKHQPRPFTVSAGDRRITATGTAFDVRLDGKQVKVVLIEGHVNVTPMARSPFARIIPSIDRLDMSPGEALDTAPDLKPNITTADVDQATSWRRGQLVFHDDTLADAVAEINRYTQRPIVIADRRLATIRISGVFGTSRPENFVAAVTAYHPVDADTATPDRIVLSSRD